MYVTDPDNDRIQEFRNNGTFIMEWGSRGDGNGQFSSHAHGIAIDSLNNTYVTDNHNIQKFTRNGTLLIKWAGQHSEAGWGDEFEELGDIEIDNDGNVYVTDKGDSSIKKFRSK